MYSYSDAFSELFVATGGSIPARPPNKWKTAILTTIPLHIIVWKVGNELAPYLIKAHVPMLVTMLILAFINVFINVYIGVPLMNYLFGEWLNNIPITEMTFLSSAEG